ncbi:DUF6221 family protein [Streptomyces sp. NPDC007991]|uniref:DUF6221 family protein n=1 Tax=Streptomyces sp. NPDC007991 TaxID=3364803 RepID=UPI0036E8D1CD
MSAQGGDILAWLQTAISEREETARRATQTAWRTHDTHLDLGGHTATVLTGERNDTQLLAWVPTMSHEPWDETRNAWNNAEHIALNDPASVLRRCAADRKLLELHRPQQDGSPFPEAMQCRTCSQDGGDGYQYLVPFPCPTVHTIAGGYGWTGGGR